MQSSNPPRTDEPSAGARPELAEAAALAAAGKRLAAIDLLTAANRVERDPDIEEELVALRYGAVAELDRTSPREPWPPSYPDPFPGLVAQAPEVPTDRLDGEVMGGAILHHGCLAVRNLLDDATVAELVADIDQALATVERWKADNGARSRCFVPFDPQDGSNLGKLRQWVSFHNCVLINDSPPAMFALLEALGSTGVFAAIEEYLGERPLLSIHKSTFRLSKVHVTAGGWHQDGAFLGDGARAVNIWMPLTDCGGDARVPGLDIFPRRVSEIFEPTRGGLANQVPGDKVIELAMETPAIRPAFRAGDALLFDECLVHCTGRSDDMDGDRYGIEFWLFAPSSFPAGYLPMVV